MLFLQPLVGVLVGVLWLDERREKASAKGEVWKYDKHCLHLSQDEVQQRIQAGEPYVIRQNVLV